MKHNWSSECEKAFKRPKDALMSTPILPYPDPKKPYVLDTDASREGLRAVLSKDVDGMEQAVAFFSCKLTIPEKNYCVTKREPLAIVKTLQYFNSYLYGAEFQNRTDHVALR